MIEDRLANSLVNMDFKRINSNSDGIYMFYRIEKDEVSVISMIHAYTGTEFTVDQYKYILEQIKTNFTHMKIPKINLLSLIHSKNPGMAKHYCLEEDVHWIIDISENRLIIYESQASNFLGLKEVVEKSIEEERNNAVQSNGARSQEAWQANPNNYNNTPYRGMLQADSNNKFKWFSPMNTIIIAANIIAYFILYHSGLFGGTDQMMSRGALNWYLVNKEGEYYRLLTSMFMHADVGHLFNNMLVLFFIGDNLERATGKVKYLFLYFGTGIIAGITSISYNMIKDTSVFSIGASGAIFGVVGAMLYVLILNRGRLENISSRQMILFTIFGLYGGIANAGIDEAAHIGGFVAGLLFAIILYRRPQRKADFE